MSWFQNTIYTSWQQSPHVHFDTRFPMWNHIYTLWHHIQNISKLLPHSCEMFLQWMLNISCTKWKYTKYFYNVMDGNQELLIQKWYYTESTIYNMGWLAQQFKISKTPKPCEGAPHLHDRTNAQNLAPQYFYEPMVQCKYGISASILVDTLLLVPLLTKTLQPKPKLAHMHHYYSLVYIVEKWIMSYLSPLALLSPQSESMSRISEDLATIYTSNMYTCHLIIV